MNKFEMEYKTFKWLPQKYQLTNTFHFTIEEVFETLETADVDISKAHSIIDPIVNIDLVNSFQHQIGPNQCQRIHKNTS